MKMPFTETGVLYSESVPLYSALCDPFLSLLMQFCAPLMDLEMKQIQTARRPALIQSYSILKSVLLRFRAH